MPVPYSAIKTKFESYIPVGTKQIPEDLEKEYFDSALGEYETELEPLTYDEIMEEIKEDLSRAKINLLAKLMYRNVLVKRVDEQTQIYNIIGKDISITGTGESKKVLETNLNTLNEEIQFIFEKLKPIVSN